MSTGRRRCAQCKYDFFPYTLPLRFTRQEWQEIIHLFLMEQSSNSIVEQTGFEKKRVLRVLLKIRMALAKDVPDIFSGTVEVDETYLGGVWKNKRKVVQDAGTKRGRGTSKQPVFGILCQNGLIWAEIVKRVDESTLFPGDHQKGGTKFYNLF